MMINFQIFTAMNSSPLLIYVSFLGWGREVITVCLYNPCEGDGSMLENDT